MHVIWYPEITASFFWNCVSIDFLLENARDLVSRKYSELYFRHPTRECFQKCSLNFCSRPGERFPRFELSTPKLQLQTPRVFTESVCEIISDFVEGLEESCGAGLANIFGNLSEIISDFVGGLEESCGTGFANIFGNGLLKRLGSKEELLLFLYNFVAYWFGRDCFSEKNISSVICV